MDTPTTLGGHARRAAHGVAVGVVLFALLLATGCAHATSPSTPGATGAATAAPPAATGTGVDVLRLNVQRAASRSVGFYTVDTHDGTGAKRTTFTTTTKGRWSGTVKVPPGSQVQLVVLRFAGGTCTITQVGFGPDHSQTLDTGAGMCDATAR